ncbi:MAG: hypothetical protein MPW14_19335 [Candidatus Manganitrophus sp.]|nr:hypothetical protein [Candidatus Manganitrophus sp.]WDT79280.1 MAG: hypothetical protein MPW14_19335 [Candidatus Manganitrophus sp.]
MGFYMRHLSVVIILISLLLSVGESYFIGGGAIAKEGRVLTPTVAELDFDTVRFNVDTQPEFRERLYERGIELLEKSGLYKNDHQREAKEKVAILILTLNPFPLKEKSPGKVMYIRKIELIERVSIVRNPKITIPRSTWTYEDPIPSIRDTITIEQLETDLDQFLSEFIRAYKLGNPNKTKR